MTGRNALKRSFVSLIILLVGTALALAEPLTPFNPEEKQELRSRLNRLLPEIQ